MFSRLPCANSDVKGVRVQFKYADGTPIPEDICVCFNLRGRDSKGKLYDIEKNISAGEVAPLWCGIRMESLPDDISACAIIAEVSSEENALCSSVKIALSIKNESIPNHGENDLWRMSRLFWLNSDIGINDESIVPYCPIEYLDDKTIEFMGKTISLSPLGLPAQIISRYDEAIQYSDTQRTELLSHPIDLIVNNGIQDDKNHIISQTKKTINSTHVCLDSEVIKNDIAVFSHVEYESDGHIDCKLVLTAQKEGDYNFQLRIPVKNTSAQMFMGMSYTGGRVPSQWEYRWDTGYVGNHAWIGNVCAGIQLKLLPEYDAWGRTADFESFWRNDGKGKMIVYKTENDVRVEGCTGNVHLRSGEKRVLHFHMITTPFHPIYTERHWKEHIYHVDCCGEERVPDLDKAKSNYCAELWAFRPWGMKYCMVLPNMLL